jgi:hypothetical protein
MDVLPSTMKVGVKMTVANTDKTTQIVTAENHSNRMKTSFEAKKSRFAEEFVQDMHSSPIAKLLDLIGSLPEIRQEKVSDVRQQLETETYNIDHNLDNAIDMMLEEFLTDC